MQVNKEPPIDLHVGQPLTQSNYTRSCINTFVLLKMSTRVAQNM